MCPDNLSYGCSELAQAVRQAYAAGQTDYAIEPLIHCNKDGDPIGRIHDGDAVIFCLRRGEREIQLTEAFVEPEIGGFPRVEFNHLPFIILTLYHEKFKDLPVAFAPSKIKATLGETVSRAKLRQLHVSESEKFAHITFFLNGGNNQPFEGETDIRIPSPRGIPPEQNPQLSLPQVSQEVLRAIHSKYDFIAVNFANGDVVGHTQSSSAKISCAEAIDRHMGEVVAAALSADYAVLVTADHGNLEEMVNPDGTPNVSHSTNPVPFLIFLPENNMPLLLHHGKLADVAPTVLSILGLPQPEVMSGRCLIPAGLQAHAQRLLLVILDGWGIGAEAETNPIFLAQTPNWDRYLERYPHTQLSAAGEAVGLKNGKNGNSEAGHMNIGAGRVILQDDVRLDQAMQDGSFSRNEIFLQAIEGVKSRNSNLHLIGLLSEKSSHGSIDYPLALLRMAKEHNLKNVYLHIIFDGRSTAPGSAPLLLSKMECNMADLGIGQVVTGMGRGIALDRDGNYQKTRLAYEALVHGFGQKYRSVY